MAIGNHASWIIVDVTATGNRAITPVGDMRAALHFRDETAAQNYIARNKPAERNWIACYLPA